MAWVVVHSAFIIGAFIHTTKSVIATQRAVRIHFAQYPNAVPDRKIILLWVANFSVTDAVLEEKSQDDHGALGHPSENIIVSTGRGKRSHSKKLNRTYGETVT